MPPAVVRRMLNLAGLEVPLVEVTGSGHGPVLTVIAGVHGCEYASMAGVRRWLRDLEKKELRGRVRAVPVLNVTAFAARSPFVVPEDGKNLNRCFPGNPDGTLGERLAYDTFSQLISGSDALVDAHCGDMVEALQPFAFYEAGPAITAEAGGCGLVEEYAVALHVAGLNAVLSVLGMTDDRVGREPARPPTHLGRFLWLRCRQAGWWQPVVAPGDALAEGQVIGTVSTLDRSCRNSA
jgi:predicted deacylase